ncbi:hypothetical protein LLEC1_06973 [Akanthomyces lecanii]|uniref:Uncharacterized protein n=1 Tax=Cordyceps confragosa TaxID=2714763 RepID=A0A179IIY7_CORDF|nr:hypothetical protein LLEC1_06973 [Akanthomyces lecanii]
MHIYHRHTPRPTVSTLSMTTPSDTLLSADATSTLSSPVLATRAQGGVGGAAAVNTNADYLSDSPSEDGLGTFRILIPITVVGWVLFGASCILCINGKGRAGHWVPKWYLDSEGTPRDRALVAAWWLAVLLLWPVILPALLARKLVRAVGKKVAKMQRRRKQGDEESHTTEEGLAK